MVIKYAIVNNLTVPSRYSQDNPFKSERKLLGRTIEKLRKEQKMTQEELAGKAAINVSYLSKIESGSINTTVRYLIKIARGLRVRVGELFGF